jgi:hypothetical protein
MFSAFDTFSRQGASARGTAGAVAPSYTGPGNIVAGAAVWGGLRAYSLATAGTRAINLRRDSDQATSDFNTLANGNLDVASIATFKGAANLFVAKLYDQSGNAQDLVQSTAAIQPAFLLGVLGSLPVMRFNGTSTCLLSNVGLGGSFTLSTVARRNSGLAAGSIVGTGSDPTQVTFGTTSGQIYMYGGSVFSISTTEGALHAIQAVFNGASSDLNIDGTSNVGNPGISGVSSGLLLGQTNNANFFLGDAVELGGWGSVFSPANSSSMSANQHAYWGF